MKNRIIWDKCKSFLNTIFYILIASTVIYSIIKSSALFSLRNSFIFYLLADMLQTLLPVFTAIRVVVELDEAVRCRNQNNGIKNIAICTLVSAAFALVVFYWQNHGQYNKETVLYFSLLCVIGSFNLSFRKIARIWFTEEVFCVIILFFLSLFGVVYNNRGDSWGYIYRTDYACILLFVLLLYCFYHSAVISGQKSYRKGLFSLTGWFCLVALLLYNILWVGGKISIVCMLLALLFGVGCITFAGKKNILFLKQKIIRIIKKLTIGFSLISFWIYAGLMIILSLGVDHLQILSKIPKLGTLIMRFRLSDVGFKLFPVQLFGNLFAQLGNGGLEEDPQFYFFLDSSYVKLLLQNGLLLFLFLLLMMTVIQLRLKTKKNYYGMLLMSLVALDCFIEHHMTDIAYNIFLLAAFSRWDFPAESSSEEVYASILPQSLARPVRAAEKRITAVWQRRPGKIRLVALGLVEITILNLCICSGRTITCWTGSTPEYSATVVLPVDQLPCAKSEKLLQNQQNSTWYYLTEHNDTFCIISASEKNSALAEQCAEYLQELGIDASRLILDIGPASLGEVLSGAEDIITERNLPDRQVICAPAILQTEIAAQAQEKGVSVYGLRARLPDGDYVLTYLRAQLNCICRIFV